MQVTLSRHALVLRGEAGGSQVRPLTAPVNDLIGLRLETNYDLHLQDQYFQLWPITWFDQTPAALRDRRARGEGLPADDEDAWQETLIWNVGEQATAWRDLGMPRLFLEAARRAAQGHFSARLAPHYERIRRQPAENSDAIPDGDLPTLAAWALDQALRLQPLAIVVCPRCHIPWLTASGEDSPYCQRPAPGHDSTCRELRKAELFRERQGPWRREYKRLHEKTRRGTLSQQAFAAWNAANTPGQWQPYEEWHKTQNAPADDRATPR
jgi:hypothetical protein